VLVLIPLLVGTLLAVIAQGAFNPVGFILVMMLGLSLQVVSNTSGDLARHQARQAAADEAATPAIDDGVLGAFPNAAPTLRLWTQGGIALAIASMIGIQFLIPSPQREVAGMLVLAALLLSAFHRESPLRIVERGWGEVMVGVGYGVLVVWLAALSQGLLWHATLWHAMVLTGGSVTTLVLVEQLSERPSGPVSSVASIAPRRGSAITANMILAIHATVVIQVVLLSRALPRGTVLLVALIPYAMTLPTLWELVRDRHASPADMTTATTLNRQLYQRFSLGLVASLAVVRALVSG